MTIIILLFTLWWVYTLSNKVAVLQKELRSFTSSKPNTLAQNIPQQKESLAPMSLEELATPLPPVPSVMQNAVTGTVPAVEAPQAAVAVATFAPHVPSKPSEFFLVTWFKEHTLIKVGALIFFLGAVWFVSYAISEGWLSPALRINLGLLTGIVLYAIGRLRLKHEKGQYIAFTALGTGVVLASVFAGQFMFELFAPFFALLIMVLSIAYTVFVSVQTRTQWLSVAAAIAGLCAPLLTNAPEPDMVSFMMYLVCLSVGFLTVVVFTQWRSVTAVLAVGVSIFELTAQSQMALSTLWLFVLIFSGVFLLSSTISLVRSQKPEVLDIAVLSLIGLVYTYFASTLSIFDGLALFVAAVVFGSIGYVLHLRNASQNIVAVYASFASVAWLLGTSFLLDGYSLLLALTVEITFVFVVLAHTQISLRALKITAAAFLIPVTVSLPLLSAQAWESGVVHSEALALCVLTLSLLGSFLWLRENTVTKLAPWCRALSANVGLLAYGYTFIFLARMGSALPGAHESSGLVYVYLLFGIFILVCYNYLQKREAPFSWVLCVAWTLVLPIMLSLPSFSAVGWREQGVTHIDALGVYGILLIILTAAVVSVERYLRADGKMYQFLAGSQLLALVLYSFGVMFVFWKSIFFEQPEVVLVLVYVGYAGLLYVLMHTLEHFSLPVAWVKIVQIAWAIPVVFSLQSLSLELWKGSVLQPQAAGIFVMLTLSLLLGVHILHRTVVDEVERKKVQKVATVFLSIAGFYAVALVWLCSHVLSATSDIAVAVSLFVYTVVGLALYVYGSSNKNRSIKYAGMVLLILVVLRLGFYEIWIMEMFWRIVTFLGIGALFMLAALLERKPVEPQS